MSFICDCGNYTLSQLGRPGCVSVQKQTARLGFMHKFDSAGNRNFIDFSGNPTIDRAFWDAYLTHPDPSKRLYLTPRLENVTHPVNERQTEEFQSGRTIETQPEYLGFLGHVVEKDAVSEAKSQYEKNKCADLVFFHVTIEGAFIGDAKTFADDQLLYGIPVQEGSYHVGRSMSIETESNKLPIGFNYDRFFDDSNMNGISESLMTDGILDIPAVTLVNGVATNPAVTGFTLELATIFLNGYSNSPIKGLIPSQIIVTEVGGTTLSVSSADENPEGTYDVAATLGSGTDYDITLDVTNHIMAPVRISVP